MTGSLRAVQTLSRVDPDFAQLCDVLYGGATDPQTVWEDVFTKADTETKPSLRRKALEGLGLGATVVGGALGVHELADAANNLGHSGLANVLTSAGKLVPTAAKTALTSDKAKVGIIGASIAGDAAATAVQAGARKTKVTPGGVQPDPDDSQSDPDNDKVTKIAVPPIVQRMAGGILKFRQAAPGVSAAAPEAAQTGSKAETAGQLVGEALSTPKKAAASVGTLTAVGVGANQSGKRKGQLQASQAPQDPANVGKQAPDVVWSGEFSKFDDDKHLAFGWASVVEKDGLPVVDRQGDYISPEEMETAAYVYVQKSRVGGDMHRRDHEDKAVHASDLVESVVFTKEKIAKMGLPASTPIGWWVGYKIHDEDVWQEVKKGGRTGFSIHGKGRRTETTVDDVMKDHR